MLRKQSKFKKDRNRAENHICKGGSTNSENITGRHDEPQNGDVAQHRLTEDWSNGCFRVATVESRPISNDRKMVKYQVRSEKIITSSTSTTICRILKSTIGKEKYPEWKLARRKEYKNGRRRRGIKGGSPGICFGRDPTVSRQMAADCRYRITCLVKLQCREFLT